MANFIGTAGFFQEERAIKRRERAMLAAVAFLGVLEFGVGCLASRLTLVAVAIGVLLMILAMRIFDRYFDREIRLARMEETGAAGEREIVPVLKKLPDSYTVVCDLDFADSYGNIDHLVIGPTGVFSIDVKKWKGTVAADGAGELLLNGKPTDKPQVRAFTARTMDLKDRLKALTRLEPYIQCLFVFPHTYLEARWGTTGTVLCVDTDNLIALITKPNPARSIPTADLSRLVAAAKALKDTIAPKPQQPSNQQPPTSPSPTTR